ncbi:MAG: carbohydrate ABC transporter permease [Chloroflexota bacterium]
MPDDVRPAPAAPAASDSAATWVRDPWPRRRRRLATALTYLALLVVAAFVLLPLWSTLWMAFDSSIQAFPQEFRLWPKTPSLDGIVDAWNHPAQAATFPLLLKNSLFVAGTSTVIAVLFGLSLAYAFARMRFPGRQAGAFAILLGSFLPFVALMVPLYLLLQSVGLRATQIGLAIVYAAIAMPLCVWLMRASFAAVPDELEQAAFLDGAGRLQSFLHVTLPLALPSILVAALVAFILGYAEFAIGWLFVEKGSDVTIAMAMSAFTVGQGSADWPKFAALVLLAIGPVVLVFVILQRALLRGSLYGTTEL